MFVISVDCTVDGRPGNGTAKGSCDEGKICMSFGECIAPGKPLICF